MKRLFTLLLLIGCLQVTYSQNIYKKLSPNQTDYKNIIDELGNPLAGKPIQIIHFMGYQTGSYIWYLNHKKATKPSYITDKPFDLVSGIYIEDHGGLLDIFKFQDFASELAQPDYLLNYCIVTQTDKKSQPEFYLTYFESSDGLDAKPLKVIVYSTKPNTTQYQKSKITAYIPYQQEDKYHLVEDDNFKKLPEKVRKHAFDILKEIKQKKILD